MKYPKILAPTIEECGVELPAGFIEAFEARLASVSIPAFLPEPSFACCDGTSYEFEASALQYGIRLMWHETYPEGWRPLTSLLLGFVGSVEKIRNEAQPVGATDNPVSAP